MKKMLNIDNDDDDDDDDDSNDDNIFIYFTCNNSK